MKEKRFFLHKPELQKEEALYTQVENRTTFNMNNCEFSIFETHKAAYGVKLHFENLGFTGMLRGRKWMKLGNKSGYFNYLPGESVLVSPGETMVIDFPDADVEPSQCISITLNPEFVQDSLSKFNFLNAKIDESSRWEVTEDQFHLFNNESLASATNNLMRIALDDNSHKDIMADFALQELLIRLMQTQARKMVEQNVLKNKSRIGFVVEYIRKNLHQKISIDELAKKSYVSKSNFFKMFREELGLTPNEFIVQERIKKSKVLLSRNNSIKETAFLSGFNDTNYFIRVFKQLEGTTPKNFQNQVF